MFKTFKMPSLLHFIFFPSHTCMPFTYFSLFLFNPKCQRYVIDICFIFQRKKVIVLKPDKEASKI